MYVQILVILAVSASVYAHNVNLPSSCDVSARTESGVVCGRIRNATDGTKYASFRGIRYGKAPRGELRFAPPQKPDTWEGVYDASEEGPICYQHDPVNAPVAQPKVMDEDCLFININTPELDLPDPGDKPRRKLPVLFWVHGGGFSVGSGDADILGLEYLMADQDIIVVTFNYRLNFFGYLSLETDKIPGNNGLRDTILALEWIQTNIKNFGGDPADVTLGGQSAGGTTAHLLAISPATKRRNLFKKVMCISGNALANFYTYSPSYSRSLRKSFLEAAGINSTESPDEIYKKLIEAPIETLMRASKSSSVFGPVIENESHNVDAIIPEDPEILINEGYGNEYPMLLSFTDNECETMRSSAEGAFKKIESGTPPVFIVPNNLLHNAKEWTIPILVEMMMTEYFNSTPLNLETFLPSCTDGFFMYPAMRVTRQRLATEAEDTFMYQFEYPGQNSVYKAAFKRSWAGAAHSEDVAYFFRINAILPPGSVNELNQSDPDSKMRLFMTESIASFVRTGKPAPASLPRGNHWPATGQQLQFLNIKGPEEYNFIEPTPYMVDKIDFFDKLYALGREG